MVNLNRLHYFYVFAQAKNVTKAADSLGISQPSLSQQLKTFEGEIGFELFFRNGRNFELTPKGKVLYEKSQDLFRSAEDIKDFVKSKTSLKVTSYSIGVSDEIERPFIAEIVGKLLRNRSSDFKKFDIVSKAHEEVVQDFQDRKLNLFITNRAISRFDPICTFEFPVNLITSKRPDEFHGVTEKSLSAMLALLDEPLVLPADELKLRSEISRFLKKNASPTKVIFESNILGCVVRAIREGVGCGFVPLPYITEDFKRKQVSVLGPKQGFWQHPIYFYQTVPGADSIAQQLSQIVKSYL
jgi:LysR family transcriptional activator of nhaA